MKIMITMLCLINIINNGFKYVIETSNLYKIDESHALKHSMEVYNFAKQIYESELVKKPYLEEQKEIIYMAAIGHDMCDKKYMDEKIGVQRYKTFLSENMKRDEIEIIGKIIETMSYSKVKVNGYPNLGDYQLAYHIVREADLLSAYDIDRCVIYGMFVENLEYDKALSRAIKLFESRVLTYISDNLFITQYSKNEAFQKHIQAEKELYFFKKHLNH
jgi:hypothetical protein